MTKRAPSGPQSLEKKRGPKNPTLKQKKAVKILIENPRKSVSAAMREAGYSEASATHPADLTRSQSFQQLMEEMGLSDGTLVNTLREGLQAEKVAIVGNGDQAMADVQPDHPTRHKFLETALRLKGLGKAEGNVNINFNNHAATQQNNYGV